MIHNELVNIHVNNWDESIPSDEYFNELFRVSSLISLLWAFNVSKIAISTINQKLIYALGAGCGAITGLLILKTILT